MTTDYNNKINIGVDPYSVSYASSGAFKVSGTATGVHVDGGVVNNTAEIASKDIVLEAGTTYISINAYFTLVPTGYYAHPSTGVLAFDAAATVSDGIVTTNSPTGQHVHGTAPIVVHCYLAKVVKGEDNKLTIDQWVDDNFFVQPFGFMKKMWKT